MDNPQNIIGLADIYASNTDIDLSKIEEYITNGTVENTNFVEEFSKNISSPMGFKFESPKNKFESPRNDFKFGNDFKFDSPKVVRQNDFKFDSPKVVRQNDFKFESPKVVRQNDFKFGNDFKLESPKHQSPKMKTYEEMRVNKINSVINSNDEDTTIFEKEMEDDDIIRMLEQIDELKSNLESEGVNLGTIQKVDENSSKSDIKRTLRILQIKNDKTRYCDLIDEVILAGAYGLETVFNGKNEILGKKIDLTGWPDTVKIKLKRSRYETGQVVSTIMKKYNVTGVLRLMLEIIPSMLIYSRQRRITTNEVNVSDNDYKNAIRDLK